MLLIVLCSIIWCMIHCYKKKGARPSIHRLDFRPSSILFHNYNSSYGFELTSITEAVGDSGMEARICK